MQLNPKPAQQTECDREAIHHIAAIQHFGGLIALTADWLIAHRSLNCGELLGLPELPQTGSPLSSHFLPRAMEALKQAVEDMRGPDDVQRMFGIRLVAGGPLLDCAVHQSGTMAVIEFEPHAIADYADHLALIGPALRQLEPIREPQELFETAARLVRQMLGYDRVMVYRFHADESGEVVAEERRDDLTPYLGLRYPRADIPQQARELFVRNRFRVIADMDADAVSIEPAMSVDGAPLDLSMSMLRAHSQMHLQYMRNMGVGASLAIAIVRHGKLWGMISCHHMTPRLPAFSLRTVCETFSQMFSMMLDRMLIERSDLLRARGRQLHDQLMLKLAGGTSLAHSVPMLEEMLADLIPHDGVSVLMNGEYRAQGAAPDKAQFSRLAPALATAPPSALMAVNALADHLPEAAEFADKAAGALVLPISRNQRDFVILWRKPLTTTVTWAGNPAKAVAPSGERLEPRSSFAAWAETVEGSSEDWSADELIIAEGLRVTLLEVVLRMSDEVAKERKRAEEQQDLLIAELNHRVRNILNLIRSLVSQSQDETLSVAQFAQLIGGRIAALASAHDNITRKNWSPAPLSLLFETELAAYVSEKRDRFVFDGEDVLIRPEAYTVLALVVHELVTNSAKYGALCDSRGRLEIHVERTPTGDLGISWRESGGPPVRQPSRRGFGSTIIERSIPFELKGEADLRFKLSGLEADFVIPKRFFEKNAVSEASSAEKAAAAANDDDRGPAGTRTVAGAAARPRHVLVVEDSMIIALDTEENLKRLGVKTVHVESSVFGALSAIDQRRPDFAIVDFNLGSESSAPVARELANRRIPFVLATGYAEVGDKLAEFGASALIRKPYGRDEIEAILDQQFG